MDVRLTPRERDLGLWWVAATIAGWAVGFVVCQAITSFISTLFIDGLIIGAGVGIAQWIVLRQRLPSVRWWAVLSIVGFGIGRAAGEIATQGLPTALGDGLTGAAIGLSVGVAQWLSLRRLFPEAGRWIPASVVAWAIGWFIISYAEEVTGSPDVTTYAGGGIGAAFAGIVTGCALIWVSRRTRST